MRSGEEAEAEPPTVPTPSGELIIELPDVPPVLTPWAAKILKRILITSAQQEHLTTKPSTPDAEEPG